MTVEEFKKIEKELKDSLVRKIKNEIKKYGKYTINLVDESLENNDEWGQYYFNVQPMVANQFSLVDITSNVDRIDITDNDILCHVIGENIDKMVSLYDEDAFSVYDYDNLLKLLCSSSVKGVNIEQNLWF